MFGREHLHGRHHRKNFTGEICPLHPPAATLQATAVAIEFCFECMREGKLITPAEALLLAGPEARAKETLFSISRRFAVDDDVDPQDILCELGHRFPDYA